MYNWPERKPLRLKKYDYWSNWFYFVTICTKWRENFFGEIVEWKIFLNDYGEIAKNEILKTEEIRKEIKIDIFVIMPNHLHLLVVIENENTVGNTGPCSLHKNKNLNENTCSLHKKWNINMCSLHKNKNLNKNTYSLYKEEKWIHITKNKLSNTIQRIKWSITTKIRKKYEDFIFWWQKSFFDKIIRNDEQLEKTREYILNNPLKWELDINNPKNIKK